MRNVLFYIAGAATVGVFFTLWCAVAVQRVRKESVCWAIPDLFDTRFF